MKILVVEDDRAVADMVKNGLASDSYTVEIAKDGAEGSFLARSYEYDAIILDYSLPKKDGLIVCEEIRRAGRVTPIIFLSATSDIPVKVSAFEKGADDYMTKPFSIEELKARIKTVARRPAQVKKLPLQVADLMLDPIKQTAKRGKKNIRLTRKEWNLLEYMTQNAGTVLSRAMLLEHVWTADSDPLSNTVEAHIRNVRKKIAIRGRPELIANVQGRGYVIDEPEKIRRLILK
ncbi:MAG: response regulator transcription factor [Patescibacteria group bacterium]